jgi:hypothetical protein
LMARNGGIYTERVYATGGVNGGSFVAMSSDNYRNVGPIEVFGTAGVGGNVLIATSGVNREVRFDTSASGNGVNARGGTQGGNIAIVATGAIVTNGAVGHNASATAAGGIGGNVFLSQGAAANLAATVNVTGSGANGSAVLMSNGNVNGFNTNQNPTPNVGYFPLVGSSGTQLTAGDIVLNSDYQITVTPGAQPSIRNLTNGAAPVYRLPAGSLTGFASFDIGTGTLSFNMANSRFLAPVVVGGAVTAGNVTGSGASTAALWATGNVTLGGAGNGGAVASAPALYLMSSQNIIINGGINSTSSAGNSGNVMLAGQNVTVSGAAGGPTAGASIDLSNANGTGNAGSLLLLASRDVTIGTWAGSNLTGNGDIVSYSSAFGRSAGALAVIGGNQLRMGDLIAGGFSNGSGSEIQVVSPVSARSGSLVNRSTSGGTVASLYTFSNDTGSGSSRGLLAGAPMSFLPGSIILTDASSSQFTSAVNLTMDPLISSTITQIVTTNLIGGAGSVSVNSANLLGFVVG